MEMRAVQEEDNVQLKPWNRRLVHEYTNVTNTDEGKVFRVNGREIVVQ